MDMLRDDLLLLIMSMGLSLEDLLRCSRVAKRWHSVVFSCDSAWDQLYHGEFGDASCSTCNAPNRGFERFKQRFSSQRKVERLKRKVKMGQLASSVQLLEHQIRGLRAELQAEQQQRDSVLQELQQLDRVRGASQAVQCWQPQALQQHYNRILQQAPIEGAWRAHNLQQDLKLCDLRISSLHNGISARRHHLVVQRRKLLAMQP